MSRVHPRDPPTARLATHGRNAGAASSTPTWTFGRRSVSATSFTDQSPRPGDRTLTRNRVEPSQIVRWRRAPLQLPRTGEAPGVRADPGTSKTFIRTPDRFRARADGERMPGRRPSGARVLARWQETARGGRAGCRSTGDAPRLSGSHVAGPGWGTDCRRAAPGKARGAEVAERRCARRGRGRGPPSGAGRDRSRWAAIALAARGVPSVPRDRSIAPGGGTGEGSERYGAMSRFDRA